MPNRGMKHIAGVSQKENCWIKYKFRRCFSVLPATKLRNKLGCFGGGNFKTIALQYLGRLGALQVCEEMSRE